MIASIEATLYPIACKINEYLSNYILVFLLLGIGFWYSIKTRFVQIRCFKEGWNSVFGNLMVEVAESIAYDLNREFIVLVRNDGIIGNFEPDAIVEVAGTIGKDGAKGYPFGDISPYYKGLMEGQYAYELLTVEAFLEQDYTKALKALILNRSVVDPSKAKAVLDDLMEANKDYWTLK